MSKKKKQSQSNNLSPEKYIKTRARKLPIHYCLISENWQENKQPVIVFSRKHTNGNITMCLYVVDLLCLGVIFSEYFFNITQEKYHELLDVIYGEEQNIDYEATDYPLIHNIIFASIEYAEGFKIQPHKKFKVTEFMLEEDSEDIELIEIECGMNGKPVFVVENYTDYNSDSPIRIINNLEKHAGHGNFSVFQNFENLNEYDDLDDMEFDDFEHDNIVEDDYDEDDFNLDKKEYLKLVENLENLSEKESKRLQELISDMINYLVDHDLVLEYYDEYFDVYFDNINSYDLSPEMIGIEGIDQETIKKIEKHYNEIFENLDKSIKKSRKNFRQLEKLIENSPLTAFVDLTLSVREDIETTLIDDKLNSALQKFPDYPLLKMFNITHQFEKQQEEFAPNENDLKISNYFSNRDTLHFTELNTYFIMIIGTILVENNVEMLEALINYVNDCDFPEELTIPISLLLLMGRISILNQYVENEQNI